MGIPSNLKMSPLSFNAVKLMTDNITTTQNISFVEERVYKSS